MAAPASPALKRDAPIAAATHAARVTAQPSVGMLSPGASVSSCGQREVTTLVRV